MTQSRPRFNQLNIVCGDPEASLAFYRRLGVDIPEERVWRTNTGAHHSSAVTDAPQEGSEGEGAGLDLDSTQAARHWNAGWKGNPTLAGKVVVGFSVASRAEVDRIYADMTGAGHRGLQPPCDAFWGARFAVIEDPDGIAVGLQSPRSDDKRAPPPEV
jgi:catechol 2,3-dioxygenase-like lactoylglutathione lyase family enzyme